MLVEAAWTILRRRSSTNATLHDWAAGIAARRGSRVAVVALARKLAGILYAMWRDSTCFAAASLRPNEVAAATAWAPATRDTFPRRVLEHGTASTGNNLVAVGRRYGDGAAFASEANDAPGESKLAHT